MKPAVHEEQKLSILQICPLRPGGGGLKALADMPNKNVNFFWTAPLNDFIIITLLYFSS